MPFSLRDAALDFFLPAVIAAAGLALAWATRLGRRDARWVGPVALSAGFAAGWCAIGGVPRWPPGTGDAAYWLAWFMAPIALLGLLDASLRPPTWARVLLVYWLSRWAFRLLLAPLAGQAGQSAPEPTLWTIDVWTDALAGAATISWLILDAQADRLERYVAPASWLLVSAGAAAVFALSANVKATLGAAALAAISLAALAVALPLRRLCLDRGSAVALSFPLAGLMAFTQFYALTLPPLTSDALLLVAPLFAWTGSLPALRSRPRLRSFVRLAPVAVVVAFAVLIAAHYAAPAPAVDAGGDH